MVRLLSALFLLPACVQAEPAPVGAPPWADTAVSSPLRLVAEDWCPHTCDERKGQPGYMVEIVRQILARNDRAASYRTTSWSRAMREVQAGDQDLIIGVSAEDAKLLSVTYEPFAFGEYCFYTLASSKWRYQDLASLASVRVVAPSGFSFDAPLNEWFAKNAAGERALRLQTEQPLAVMPNRLYQFRSDVMLVSEAVMRYYSGDSARIASLRNAGCYPFREPFYIGAQKGSKVVEVILPLLDTGLRELKRNQELAPIYARYQLASPKD